MKKIRVGILFGGKSAEHKVSLQSAANVVRALDKSKYEPILIGIDTSGQWWLLSEQTEWLLNRDDPQSIKINTKHGHRIAVVPKSNGAALYIIEEKRKLSIDIVFPVLHGPYGEDGTVQGFLKFLNIPFVGSSVLGSAIAMDKDVSKRMLQAAGIPVAKFLTFRKGEEATFELVQSKLGNSVFVKPANLGSSIGIRKVVRKEEFDEAIEEAFSYDNKIVIEEAIVGREIECGVLGHFDPRVSVLGEVIYEGAFYSYESKYFGGGETQLQVPADIPGSAREYIQQLAIASFRALECVDLARVDFFLKEDGTVLVNEINTLPGFTQKSMYPLLWEKSGISYSKLIDVLIQQGLLRFK